MPIHVLYHGRQVCDSPELAGCSVPDEWPPGHSWVDPTMRNLADCPRCRAFFEENRVVVSGGRVLINPKPADVVAAALLVGRPWK
jgi:hypothetical protein